MNNSTLRGRAAERGAAVFVVVMAITLLTAVGLFAAHSATLVDQAAGYARMARQTQYLAEQGLLTTAAELGNGGADRYVLELDGSKAGTPVCPANAGVSGGNCFKFEASDLDARVLAASGGKLIEATAGDGTPGSLGKNSTAVVGLTVQLTELVPVDRPVPGTEQGKGNYQKVTATTTAQVRSSAAACAENVSTTLGQQTMRAQLLIGPLVNQ